MHSTVWAKVNVPVDEGIAEVVELLSRIPGLQTLDSCQGDPGGRPAHVFFHLGEDWREIGALLFDQLSPRLDAVRDDGVISLEVFNGSQPRGRIAFSAEATSVVTSALKEVLITRRSYTCSCDTWA